LHEYWKGRCRGRTMPARADIDPADLKALLPNLMIYQVDGPDLYSLRLVGSAIVAFVGQDFTGKVAGSAMTAEAKHALYELLGDIVRTQTPRFRAGKAFWWQEKNYREYEACFLPLSTDGKSVNQILVGTKFDLTPEKPPRP